MARLSRTPQPSKKRDLCADPGGSLRRPVAEYACRCIVWDHFRAPKRRPRLEEFTEHLMTPLHRRQDVRQSTTVVEPVISATSQRRCPSRCVGNLCSHEPVHGRSRAFVDAAYTRIMQHCSWRGRLRRSETPHQLTTASRFGTRDLQLSTWNRRKWRSAHASARLTPRSGAS
jgi:hypothetical protein